MNTQEPTKYEKLRIFMYGWTTEDRKESRDFWRLKGFARMSRGGKDDLFDYWKKRLDSEPEVQKRLDATWQFYLKVHGGDPNPRPAAAQQDNTSTNAPSLTTQVKSLASAVKNLAMSGFAFAPGELYNERVAICKGCPQWDPSAFLNTGKCNLCGCSTQAKLRLPLEKCPIDKWLPVNVQERQSQNLETPGDQSTQASQ
jgi:hypothetical protein